MSIRYKIAFLFAVLVTVIFILISVVVYYFSKQDRENTFNTRLKNRAMSTAVIAAGIKDTNYSVIGKLDASSIASLNNKSITVQGYNNEVLYQYADGAGNELSLTDHMVEQTKIRGEYLFTDKGREAIAIHYVSANHNFIVALAAFDSDGESFLQILRRLLLWALLGAVIVSYLVGILFAGTLIKPLRRISAEVRLISSNNLSQRIQKGPSNDELNRLGDTFNDLLNRLQESFVIQRRFISNASHELSTPLTAVSSQLEVALQKNRTEQEYREVLKSVLDDIKDLQQLTRSLLDIAKTGTQGSIELHEVRLDEVILKVAADVQKLKSGYQVAVNFDVFPDDEEMLTVFGNSNLLYIALKNIIENGCKYSDDNKAIVTASFTKSAITIRVLNKGDIITEADIQNVFQPFFRTTSAQHKQGFGLGLTLTKRILSLHKATIEIQSDLEKGTVFTIVFPQKTSLT